MVAKLVNIHWETLVISDSRDHFNMGELFPDEIGNDGRKVSVVRLGLAPDVMRSVVSRPDDRINVLVPDLLEEELESIEREIAIPLVRSPVACQ